MRLACPPTLGAGRRQAVRRVQRPKAGPSAAGGASGDVRPARAGRPAAVRCAAGLSPGARRSARRSLLGCSGILAREAPVAERRGRRRAHGTDRRAEGRGGSARARARSASRATRARPRPAGTRSARGRPRRRPRSGRRRRRTTLPRRRQSLDRGAHPPRAGGVPARLRRVAGLSRVPRDWPTRALAGDRAPPRRRALRRGVRPAIRAQRTRAWSPARSQPGSRTEVRLGARAHATRTFDRARAPPAHTGSSTDNPGPALDTGAPAQVSKGIPGHVGGPA